MLSWPLAKGYEHRTKDEDCIPAATPKIEQNFCSLPFTKICPLSCRKKRLCVHTTPPFPASAVPAGITHYTLQARLCAKGRLRPPLETPEKLPCTHCINNKKLQLFIVDSSLRAMQKATECPRFRLDIRRPFARTGT